MKGLASGTKLWCAWVLMMIFVYPLPNTAALRNLLILLGLVGLGYVSWRDRRQSLALDLRPLRPALWWFAALCAWMLVHLACLAWYPSLSLDMFRGDWAQTWAVGAGAGILAVRLNARDPAAAAALCTTALIALMLHVVWLLGYQLWIVPSQGMATLGMTPFAQRDYQSTLIVTVLALLLAELPARLRRGGTSLLLLGNRTLLACLTLALIATVTVRARNGSVVAFVLVGVCALMLLLELRRRGSLKGGRMAALGSILLIGIGAFGWLNYKTDARWQAFGESAAVAVDIHANLFWLDPALGHRPVLADGSAIEESAYDRIAWGTAALEQISEHPLGIGYGHKAFGWAVNRAFNVQTGHESSHNGLLDFTLANGIPGLILWLGLCASLFILAWRIWRDEGAAVGVVLFMHFFAYLGRIALDGHFSGFRLKLFVFVLGLILGALLCRDKGAHAA